MEKSKKTNHTIVYVAVNKNGFLSMHLDYPKKNETTGKWVSSLPYCNSKLHNQLVSLFKNTTITYESEPQCFEI